MTEQICPVCGGMALPTRGARWLWSCIECCHGWIEDLDEEE